MIAISPAVWETHCNPVHRKQKGGKRWWDGCRYLDPEPFSGRSQAIRVFASQWFTSASSVLPALFTSLPPWRSWT